MSAKVSVSLGTTTKSWTGECICSEWTRVVKDRVSETEQDLQRLPEQPQVVQEAIGCVQRTKGDMKADPAL